MPMRSKAYMCLGDFEIEMRYGRNAPLFPTLEAAHVPPYANACGIALVELQVLETEDDFDPESSHRRLGPLLGFILRHELPEKVRLRTAGTIVYAAESFFPPEPHLEALLVPVEMRLLKVVAEPFRPGVFYYEQYYYEFCDIHPGVRTKQ